MRSRRWRYVARRHFSAAAEEVLFHLLGKPFARAHVGERQPVLVDEHRLMLEPLRPRFLRHVLVDALAELARVGREVQPLGLTSKLDAVDHPCHSVLLRKPARAPFRALLGLYRFLT